MDQATPPESGQPHVQQPPHQQSYQWSGAGQPRQGYDVHGMYRRPNQSSYAKTSWWARLIGEVGGFFVGAIIGLFAGIFIDWIMLNPFATVSAWTWLIGGILGGLGFRHMLRPRHTPPPPYRR